MRFNKPEKCVSNRKPRSAVIIHATAAAAVIASVLISESASAQNPTPAPAAAAVAEAERVIVTGSNIPTAEEVGPNPVDTYRTEDIQKLGVRNTSDLVKYLPAATGGSITENISNGGDGSNQINLRGILAKETLVLIDGRRAAPVGFAGVAVDLNVAVPLGLVDHIDILKDGASAIYGADAVGGVFNVYLKHKFRGLELYASYGNTNLGASNDQHEFDAYLLAGTGNETTDIVVYAEYYDRGAIYSRDRDISSNADHRRFGGGDGRSSNFAGRIDAGFTDVPGTFVPPGSRIPSVTLTPGLRAPLNTPGTHPYSITDPNSLLAAGYIPRTASLDTGRPANGVFRYNFADLTPSFPPADREHFYGSVVQDICDKWLTVFADFRFTRTFWDSGLAASPFTEVFYHGPDFVSAAPITPEGSGISVPTQNAFNPFSQGTTTVNGIAFITGVRYRSLETGLRTDKITTNNYLFTGGLRGTFSSLATSDILKTWGYELGFRYNRDNRVESFGGIVDSSAMRTALLSTDPNTAFDVFGRNLNGSGTAGRTNKSVLDRVFITTNHAGNASLTLEDSKLYGDMWKLPAGPISFAIGGEHRRDTTIDEPDPLTSSGQTIGATTFEPTRGNRDVWSVYGELRIPVTSPTWNFFGLHSLEFDLAERYEYFSDFADTEKPKFSVRYQPFDTSLTLRATYNEAFHAPTLAELFLSQSTSFAELPDLAFPSKDPDNEATTAVAVLAGGNPTLQPENAYEWTYGAVWTPKWVPGLTLSVDWYHIDLRNFIGVLDTGFIIERNSKTATEFSAPLPGAPNGVPLNGEFQNLITRDPVTGHIVSLNTINMNIGRIITEGLDYQLIYQFDTSRFGRGNWGTLTATINGTYLSRFEFQSAPHTKEFGLAGTGPGGSIGNLTHHRLYASLFYDLGGFDTGVTMHFQGQYGDTQTVNTLGFEPRKVRESYTFDWTASYSFNFPAPAVEQPVAGYAKDGSKQLQTSDAKTKNVMPVSTASYSDCGWRSWLNGTTITLGLHNIFDADPPFGGGAFENGFDEASGDARGRVWYVALKKRF